jgi:hypothetical protein
MAGAASELGPYVGIFTFTRFHMHVHTAHLQQPLVMALE